MSVRNPVQKTIWWTNALLGVAIAMLIAAVAADILRERADGPLVEQPRESLSLWSLRAYPHHTERVTARGHDVAKILEIDFVTVNDVTRYCVRYLPQGTWHDCWTYTEPQIGECDGTDCPAFREAIAGPTEITIYDQSTTWPAAGRWPCGDDVTTNTTGTITDPCGLPGWSCSVGDLVTGP